LKGQVILLGFLYTNCPEACPIVAANFAQVRHKLGDAPNAGNLAQVLVSTDPENDDLRRRKVYTQGIGGDWFFVGGQLEDVAPVWDAYEIYREVVERNQEVVVYHSYRTYLIDQEGKIRYTFIGVWYPDDINPYILNILGEG
jgi:protein SCO1/2